jgi:WD40 repeat protein
MKKDQLIFLIPFAIIMIFVPWQHGQAQVGEPWGDVVRVASFGYGSMLSVNWSAENGQLAVSSETGFQFYDEAMVLQAERRFEIPLYEPALFSPDFQLVAMPEPEGLIIRDTRTWQPIFTLTNYAAPSWSPDSQQLAVWVGDTLRVWDVRNATVTREVSQLVSQNVPVQWSPDGEFIALPGAGAVLMVTLETGEIVNIHPFDSLSAFTWSLDGRWFAIVGRKDRVPVDHDPNIPVLDQLMLMDPITGEIIHQYDLSSGGRQGTLYGASGPVRISPDGRFVSATISRWEPPDPTAEDPADQPERWSDMGLGVWELESGAPLHDFSDTERPLARIHGAAWNPVGTHFASANGFELTVFEAESGQVVDQTLAYIDSTNQTEWDSEGHLIAAGGVWDLSNPVPEFVDFEPHVEPPAGPDLEFLQPNPYVYDYNMPPYDWEILHVYPDRDLVLTYEIDIEYPGTPEYEDDIPPEERYKIWDIESGRELEERVYLGLQNAWLYDLENADIRAEGNTQRNVFDSTRFIGIGDDQLVDLREYQETPLEIDQQERWQYREVWFSPDGTRIFAYETDGTFKAFDPVSGDLLYQTVLAGRNTLAWVSDNSMFTVLDDAQTVYVYDGITGDLLLEAVTGNSYPQLLWSPDLAYLALGGDNQGIILYHVPTRSRLTVLRGHQSAITSMGWNPACNLDAYYTCEHLFASSDTNGRIIVWGVPQAQEIAQVLPEYPAEPRLELPPATIDLSSLSPLWTYVERVDTYGKPAVQTIRWVPGVIRVNENTYYDEALEPMESEDIPRDSEWYRLEDTGNQVRLVRNVLNQEETQIVPLGLERDGTLRDADGDVQSNLSTGGYVSDATFNLNTTLVYTAENDGGSDELSGWIGRTVLYGNEWRQHRVRFGGGSPGYNQIEFSPDGSLLATATIPYYRSGGRGQVWSPDTYTLLCSLIGHTNTITKMVWHPTDGTVITSSLDGSVRKWNLQGQQVARWNHEFRGPVVQMEWAGSALLLSAGEDMTLLNPTDLSVIRTYEKVGGGPFEISPEHRQVLALGYDSVLRVVDFQTEQPSAEERQHTPSFTNIAWHPSGDHLVVSRTDGSIVTIDAITGFVLNVLRANGPVLRSMEWDATGERLLLDPYDEDYVEIISGDTGDVLLHLENQYRRPGVWWSPDGAQIAFGAYPDPIMGVYTATSMVNIHDSRTGALTHHLTLDWDDYIWYWEREVFYLNWSDDSQHIAAFFDKDKMRVWELDGFEGRLLGEHAEVGSDFAFSIWEENEFRFWTTSGEGEYSLSTDTLNYVPQGGMPQGVMLRPDGRVFLAGSAVLDRGTLYPLQQIDMGYTDAAWHPFCWSADCPAMLAVSSGYNITMYGFPREEAVEIAQGE